MSTTSINNIIDSDLTAKPISKPELVKTLKDMTSALETDIGGGGTSTNTFTGVGDPGLTRAQAVNTTFTTPPQTLRTTGYSSPGDYGGALYKKIDALPASPLNVGTFTTLDGAHYQMVPDGSDVYVNAFGAQSRASNDLSHDNWQAFEDCKYWILSQQDAANLQSANMRVGPGCYYLSKAHSMEGGPYNLIGTAGNSMIRVPWNQDGIQIQARFGSNQTIGHEGSPVNSGTIPKGMEVYWPGSTHVYVCTTAGNVNTGVAPTSTGTGVSGGGTAVFDYVRELQWSETRGQGGGSLVSDLTVWSLWDANDPTQRDEDVTVKGGGFHSAIVMKSRATILRVFAAQFPGHGICVAADGDPEVRAAGNANQWRIDRCSAYWNGHDGVHIGYSDANAGVGIDIDVASNLRWGIADWSFLGNRFLSVQSANDGRKFIGARNPGMCVHNGYWWLARMPSLGVDSAPNYANEPGTDTNSWIRWSGDGQAFPGDDTPPWDVSKTFVPCGPFSSNNANASTQWYGTYVEGGANPPQFAARNTVFGGIGTENSHHGEQVYNNTFSNSLLVGTAYSGADGVSTFSARFGPNSVDAGKETSADTNILTIDGADNSVSLCVAENTSPPSITGSIADTVASSAAFHGQIGVGDAGGANVYSNVLFVTSTESGTVLPGQSLSGPGIPAGTVIGSITGFWPNSFIIVTGDGSKIGNQVGDSTVPGITNEAMTSQFVLPVLTVTACPTDAISLGATLTGGGLTGTVQIAKQLDPTTLNNASFTGGVGKYALNVLGHTIASTSFVVTPNLTKNADFALTSFSDRGKHVWGWTGQQSKRKFGRVNPVSDTFFASQMLLGSGGRGMDDQKVRVLRLTDGAPDNGGDYKSGEWRFNSSPFAGAYPLYVFCGTDTGLSGTPKWVGVGAAFS